MSTGYDDRDDDRDDDRLPGPGRGSGGVIERAKSQVAAPAILLILTGAIALILAILNLINSPQIGAQFDEQIAQVENKPNVPADQKKAQVDMMTQMRDIAVPIAVPFYAVNTVVALIVLLGGIKMRSLSGRGLAVTGSVLAMLPLINGCCCILGLPIGIWCLLVLSRPEVKAGFAAVRSARTSRDGY